MELVLQLLAAAAVVALAALITRRLPGSRLPAYFRPRRGDRWMVAVERLALTPQHTLHLVRVRDRAVLVAAHRRGCQVLASLPWEPGEEESALPERAEV